MDRLRGWVRRIRAVLMRDTADREMRDEMEFHTTMEADALRRSGLEPEAARRAALVRFGGLDRYGEESRDARGTAWLDEVRHDFRLSVRLASRNVPFSAAVVVTLALGIGATTAIFSMVDGVLLRGWPFADGDRLVMIWETDRASETLHEPASWPDIVDMRTRTRAFTEIGAVVALNGTMTGTEGAERVSMLGVTTNMLDVLGVTPAIGRGFRAGEASGQGVGIALLSERYWLARFGGDRAIIGNTVAIDGRPIEIIGVLPRDADLGMAQVHANADYSVPLSGPADLWLAVEPTTQEYPRQTHPFLALGRLADGATLAAAQQEMAAVMTDLEATFPENEARGVNLEPYENVTFGQVRRALVVLLAAVAVVLLVACVNVANLLLARTATRKREVGVRRALGASMARIGRQFLVESIVLTVLGAVAGVALARIALRALVALAPPDIPRLDSITLDLRVLAIATTVSMLVSVLFGLAPVLEARRLHLQRVLRSQAGRTTTDSRDSRRFRDVLVVAEVALAIVLVIGAALLGRSFQTLTATDPGFRTAGIVTAEYELQPASRYPFDFSRWPLLTEINNLHASYLERVRTLPGVQHAALAARNPLDPGFTNSFVIVGREEESADYPEIRTRMISAGYLETLDVALLDGRDISAADVAGAEPIALINESGMRRYFDGTDPIDSHVRFWGTPWRIVGVIADERFNGVDADPEPALYVPLAQAPQAGVTVLARASGGDPTAIAPDLRRLLRELDPGLALAGIETLDRTLAVSVARPRFTAALIGLFAGLALVLALIGVHGVLSYSVTQRTAEVGIRLALGATRGNVIGLIIREGITLAVIGTVIGLAIAAAAAQGIGALLYGVTPLDAATFTAVPVAVVGLAALASYLPALRAARAQPLSALRTD